MNLSITHARSSVGIYAQSVCVEVHLSNGLPSFTIVGLPETAVKESKDRVRSAILMSQYEFPCKKIIVNLAPANLPKLGSGFDLPIAIGILAASGQIPAAKLEHHEFIAELALNGNLRGIHGVIPAVLATKEDERSLIIAKGNAQEAALTRQNHVYIAENLREVCGYLSDSVALPALPEPSASEIDNIYDWSDIRGQQHAKYAMQIAACGGHSVLLFGPPGSGKTMLASRFPTLLPLLSETQALECAAIRSIKGATNHFQNWRQPPFRSPHHTASAVALIGGGNPPKPGEISLAHHGILFLDELPEFNRFVLDSLREPLEAGSVCISRAAIQSEFPARFQFISAMNPCPCGHWGNPNGDCTCTPERINRYLSRISGPLLDRIDIHVNVKILPQEELLKPQKNALNISPELRNFVEATRTIQYERQGCLNAHLSVKACEEVCEIGPKEQEFLSSVLKNLKLSARSFHRLLKTARTLVDMKREDKISLTSLQQALSFRNQIQKI